MQASPSLLIVENDHAAKIKLRSSLESLGCCKILAEVTDGEAALRETQRLRPEIILIDVDMPGINGIEATWKIKRELPQTHVVMLSSHMTQDYATAAFDAGADGYCSKVAPIERIASAINAVMSGKTWLDPDIAQNLMHRHTNKPDTTANFQSGIEMLILHFINEGMNNKEIAARLNVTTEQIASSMHNIIYRYVKKTAPDRSESESQILPEDWLTGSDANLREGKIFIDKYLVENLVGSGNLGAVFRAKHLYMNRHVALKLLRPEFSANRLNMRYFQREAMAIARLQHKNIVGVHDFGISKEGVPYLIMEYIDGANLAAILEKKQKISIRRLINICLQICAGLAEAHSNGIIHCDLKPSNILVLNSEREEKVKIVDFGLAQVLPPKMTTESRSTDQFFVNGTPLYMSPEQCIGTRLDGRSDIYSLGCVLYEALTGVNIFQGLTPMETLVKQCHEVAPPMSSVCHSPFPPQLEHCVSKMLAKDPLARPQTMEEVTALLLVAQ